MDGDIISYHCLVLNWALRAACSWYVGKTQVVVILLSLTGLTCLSCCLQLTNMQ